MEAPMEKGIFSESESRRLNGLALYEGHFFELKNYIFFFETTKTPRDHVSVEIHGIHQFLLKFSEKLKNQF